MKKITMMLSLLLVSGIGFAQKKKTAKPAVKPGKNVLATADGLTAELQKGKNNYAFYVLAASKEAKGKKDTLKLKEFENATTANNLPVDAVIKPFTAKGVKLHEISWTEKSYTEVPDKKEDATRTVTQIWNVDTRTQLHSNTQTQTKITEILWLDKGKNASQTSEKLRNEGFALTVGPDGDLTLKNKTQENKMSYDAAANQYVAVKGAPQSGAAPAKKKK